MSREPTDAYEGPVEVSVGGATVTVHATLRGHFEPIDGRHHWYGRLAASDQLDVIGSGTEVVVTTGRGSAPGRLSDQDPWGRLRVAGVGRPPY